MNLIKLLLILAVLTTSPSVFAVDTAITADRTAVDNACTAEAQAAGCGSEVVGKGLLKCFHAFKRANPKTFQLSSACKTAIATLHADKKADK